MTKEALKLALEAIDVYCPDYMHGLPKKHYIAAIKEALAQPMHKLDAAIKTLEHLKYTYHGGEYWKPPLGEVKALAQPVQPEERNFCPRCGKRTADLTAIHTCTPPMEKNT
jgi:hypothetical protein